MKWLAWAPVALLLVSAESARAAPVFADVTAQTGIDFRHEDGRTGDKYYVETLGAGAAWLDYDRDGDLDI